MATTVFYNETNQPLNMKVGSNRSFCDLTVIQKGANYKMQVDFNATYQEFFMGVETEGKQIIMNSDDCCDYKRITIKEVDGKFDVIKEPRSAANATAAEEKPKASSWNLRSGLRSILGSMSN